MTSKQFLYYQKEIYKSGKSHGPVKVLKGKEILPDDSTLEENGIVDDDAVNIVIEPEKEITIYISKCFKFTPIYPYKLANSVPVSLVKKKLIMEDKMVIPESEFDLEFDQDDKREVVLKLDDLGVPLHYYGINEGSLLLIVKNFASCIIENQKGAQVHINLSAKARVGELRKKLAGKDKPAENVLLFGIRSGPDKKGQQRMLYKRFADNEENICP